MITIVRIEISRYRSILNLQLDVDTSTNLISICGENNVGKTNTLRAINLFFNPDIYDIAMDRPTLKHAQGGSSIDPSITIIFYSEEDSYYYEITRQLKQYGIKASSGLSGYKYKKRGQNIDSKTKITLLESQIIMFLSSLEFRYIESINVDIPRLVEELATDVIDVQYSTSRISSSRHELKKAYDSYVTGLQGILNAFADSISNTFKSFRENWSLSFNVPSSSETLRDLISDDIELVINDKGCLDVVQKGTGLQRLAVIILHFEILKRIKKKKGYFLCIDEPDIYLHEGLQKKLATFFKSNSQQIQTFYTTHSRVFIDESSMKNVVLLGAKHYSQMSKRKQKNIDVTETVLIDLSDEEGYEKICDHLGIEKNNYDILAKQNIIVEGGCDEKYLQQLASYFSMKIPKIIRLDGVDNAERFLNFYNSYYRNNRTNYKPQIKILFDNDSGGRKTYSNIKPSAYQHIDVYCIFVNNFLGDSSVNGKNNQINHEIEDLIYPEIMCYLANKLLDKKRFNKINASDISEKIKQPSRKNDGILSLIDHNNKDINHKNGHEISFVSNDVKSGLAGMFNISGDRNLIRLMDECKNKYPTVRTFLEELVNFS